MNNFINTLPLQTLTNLPGNLATVFTGTGNEASVDAVNNNNGNSNTIVLEEYDGTSDIHLQEEPQNPHLVMRLQQLAHAESNLTAMDLELAQEQEEQVLELAQDISNLREMFEDMHQLVQADDEMIDEIEINVDKAEANTEKGVISLTKAANISHAVTIPVTLAVGGLLLGPGAMALLGVKSAISVGAISAGGALGGVLFGKQVHTMTKSTTDEEFKEKEVKEGPGPSDSFGIKLSKERVDLDLRNQLKRL